MKRIGKIKSFFYLYDFATKLTQAFLKFYIYIYFTINFLLELKSTITFLHIYLFSSVFKLIINRYYKMINTKCSLKFYILKSATFLILFKSVLKDIRSFYCSNENTYSNYFLYVLYIIQNYF